MPETFGSAAREVFSALDELSNKPGSSFKIKGGIEEGRDVIRLGSKEAGVGYKICISEGRIEICKRMSVFGFDADGPASITSATLLHREICLRPPRSEDVERIVEIVTDQLKKSGLCAAKP